MEEAAPQGSLSSPIFHGRGSPDPRGCLAAPAMWGVLPRLLLTGECANPAGNSARKTLLEFTSKSQVLSGRWRSRGDRRGLGWKARLVSARGAGGCPCTSIRLSVLVLACLQGSHGLLCPGSVETRVSLRRRRGWRTLGVAKAASGGPSPPQCLRPQQEASQRSCAGRAPGRLRGS